MPFKILEERMDETYEPSQQVQASLPCACAYGRRSKIMQLDGLTGDPCQCHHVLAPEGLRYVMRSRGT